MKCTKFVFALSSQNYVVEYEVNMSMLSTRRYWHARRSTLDAFRDPATLHCYKVDSTLELCSAVSTVATQNS